MTAPPTAEALLNTLLDRHERQSQRVRRVIERAPLGFGAAAAQEAFAETIKAAESLGAVEIEYGRGEVRHLIDRVILEDPAKLYKFLHRTPRDERAAASAARLQAGIDPRTELARKATDYVREAWLAGKDRPLGLALNDPDEAIRFIRIFDAALAKPIEDRTDLRTWSRRTTGDSKAIESQAARIAAVMKLFGVVAPELDESDVLIQIGLEKYPQPVLIAGPVVADGVDVSRLLYCGVPPDAADRLTLSGPIQSALTIENLASFNRHVREVRGLGELVVFTGGFPSRAVVKALQTLCRGGVDRLWHWGDIDAGGLRIADFLARNLPVPVHPHLMTEELARTRGTKVAPIAIEVEATSPVSDLAAFLCSDAAATLEQEELDPQSPGPWPS